MKKIKYIKNKLSDVEMFRRRQGFDLVDITQLCEFKLGRSGSCNAFHEPNQEIYHVQIWYRDECICNINGRDIYPIDDNKYAVFIDDDIDHDFIVFMKVYRKRFRPLFATVGCLNKDAYKDLTKVKRK